MAYCDIISNVDWQITADVDCAVFLDVSFLTDDDWRVISADYAVVSHTTVTANCYITDDYGLLRNLSCFIYFYIFIVHLAFPDLE